MRILFVSPNLGIGGVQRQWSLLVPGLRARGHDVLVLALDSGGPFADELKKRGVEVRVAGLRSRFDVLPLTRALATSGWRPDAVVSHSVSAQVVAAWIAWRARAPHVVADHVPVRADGTRRPWRLHQLMLICAIARTSARVVVVSEACRHSLAPIHYQADRIRVIANGVDEAPSVPGERKRVRDELGIPEDRCMVLLAAALRPEKRPDVFVDAVELARQSAPIVGVVAGDGPELRRLAGRPSEGLRMIGRRTNVQALIDAADVVCLTSDAEALPMLVLEAMAASRPVVATDVGGTREAVLDGVTGFVVPPGDAQAVATRLVQLAEQPRLREDLGRNGMALQRDRFTTAQMVDGYEAVLREAAAI
jgi:glycosyltransferase involved in cell wall biosynthesis